MEVFSRKFTLVVENVTLEVTILKGVGPRPPVSRDGGAPFPAVLCTRRASRYSAENGLGKRRACVGQWGADRLKGGAHIDWRRRWTTGAETAESDGRSRKSRYELWK